MNYREKAGLAILVLSTGGFWVNIVSSTTGITIWLYLAAILIGLAMLLLGKSK